MNNLSKGVIALIALAVGYGSAHFFPKIVEVEKRVEVPVEKRVEIVVDKPVERIVEKRIEVPVTRTVEVPAKLSNEQLNAIAEGNAVTNAKFWDPKSPSCFGDRSKTVKVVVQLSADAEKRVSKDAIQARVETAFRNCGFKIAADDVSVNTIVIVDLDLIAVHVGGLEKALAGRVGLTINQFVTSKLGWFSEWNVGSYRRTSSEMIAYAGLIVRPKDSYGDIPAMFSDYAITASNDLIKACERDQAAIPLLR